MGIRCRALFSRLQQVWLFFHFAWLYFHFGYAPVATVSSPIPFEKQLASMALHARIRKEASKSSPLLANDKVYQAGAQTILRRPAVDFIRRAAQCNELRPSSRSTNT
jgi:hypothetical protein